MTIDELFTPSQKTAAETLSDVQVDTSKMNDLEWTAYWDNRGLSRGFSVRFHHHTWPTSSYDSLYSQKDIERFKTAFSQMLDVVTDIHSDIKVEKNIEECELTFRVMFTPGRSRDVISFFIRLWKLCGYFSASHYSPSVNYFSWKGLDDSSIMLDGLRYMAATLDGVRKNISGQGGSSNLTHDDLVRFTATLKQSGLFSKDTDIEEIARLLVEYVRKSLNLRTPQTGEEYSPEWADFIVKEILKKFHD